MSSPSAIGLTRRLRTVWTVGSSRLWLGIVSYPFSDQAIEFLENYPRDVPRRWSAADLEAQQEFVNGQLAGSNRLDWSTPSAALDLVQAVGIGTPPGVTGAFEAVLLAGPVTELLPAEALLGHASKAVRSGGKLAGIIPCLRDNSPESQEFMNIAAAGLWPYFTAEDLLEMFRETGWRVEHSASGFVPIRRFNEAVLRGELGFTGFGRLFGQLNAQGYDPMEVGWGELRVVATLESMKVVADG
jgi:hypothetical protein